MGKDVLCVVIHYSVERSSAVNRASDSPLRGSGFEYYAAVSKAVVDICVLIIIINCSVV